MKKETFTKLIAHRGANQIYLENTKPAFVCAGKDINMDGIECDIHATLDNRLVCFHDKSLKRLNGNKVLISKTPWFILKRYRLFDNRPNIIDMGYSICKFTTYLKICKKYKKIAIVEIKGYLNQEQIDKLIKIIHRYRYVKNVVFISFQQNALKYLRELLPNAKLQLLVKYPIRNPLNFCVKNNIDVSLYYPLVKGEVVKEFHAHGLQVATWTVNNLQLAKKLKEMGVDYITTDYSFNLKLL